jgi:hypothetical protein
VHSYDLFRNFLFHARSWFSRTDHTVEISQGWLASKEETEWRETLSAIKTFKYNMPQASTTHATIDKEDANDERSTTDGRHPDVSERSKERK